MQEIWCFQGDFSEQVQSDLKLLMLSDDDEH